MWIIQYLPLCHPMASSIQWPISPNRWHCLCSAYLPVILSYFQRKILKSKNFTETGFLLLERRQNLSIHIYTFRLQILQWMLYHADSLELNVMTNSFCLLQWQRSIQGGVSEVRHGTLGKTDTSQTFSWRGVFSFSIMLFYLQQEMVIPTTPNQWPFEAHHWVPSPLVSWAFWAFCMSSLNDIW